jgi:hypothetical protein
LERIDTGSVVGVIIGAYTAMTWSFGVGVVSRFTDDDLKLLDFLESCSSISRSGPRSIVSGVKLPAVLVTENPVRLYNRFFCKAHFAN